MFPETTNLFF